jgi:hypothetical protein
MKSARVFLNTSSNFAAVTLPTELSVAAVRASNPDCSPFGIDS